MITSSDWHISAIKLSAIIIILIDQVVAIIVVVEETNYKLNSLEPDLNWLDALIN